MLFLFIAVPVSLAILALLVIGCVSYFTPCAERDKKFFIAPRDIYSPNYVEKKIFASLIEADEFDPHHTRPEVYLSIIIPAMNEQDRLPLMLDESLTYLENRRRLDKTFTYEMIIVDDASIDRTADVFLDFENKCLTNSIFVLKLRTNMGKGGAVRSGVLCSRGKFILFCDADGATKFSEIEKLEREMRVLCNGENSYAGAEIDWTHPSVVVGSRAHLEKDSIAHRSFFRTILMYGFHAIVYTLVVRSIRDTQCGFKLFSRAAAARLFLKLHIERWAFDVELLYIAEKLDFSIGEVAVQWTEVDGSKVTPILSWLQMGRDIVLIWFRYTFGIWSLKQQLC